MVSEKEFSLMVFLTAVVYIMTGIFLVLISMYTFAITDSNFLVCAMTFWIGIGVLLFQHIVWKNV